MLWWLLLSEEEAVLVLQLQALALPEESELHALRMEPTIGPTLQHLAAAAALSVLDPWADNVVATETAILAALSSARNMRRESAEIVWMLKKEYQQDAVLKMPKLFK